MSTIATEQITLSRVDDGEMSPEQLAQLNQASLDATSAAATANAANSKAEQAELTANNALESVGNKVGDDNTKAYTKNVPSNGNYARIKSILGESVASRNIFDQLTKYTGSGFTWNNGTLSATVYNLYSKHIMATADMVGKTYMVSADVYVPTGSVTGVNLAVMQGGTATYSATVTANGTWKRATVKWTPTSTSDYFYITYNGSGGTSVTAQIKNIQWELGTTATDYLPYALILDCYPTEIVSDGNVLNTNYGVLRSAGTVHDELDLENGKIIRRVGTVDLGTLSWGGGNGSYFWCTTLTDKKPGDTNIICGRYATSDPVSASNMKDKTIKGTTASANLYVMDSAYTVPSDLKASLQGVLLNYELATPYEEPISFKGNVLSATSTITFKNNGDAYGLHQPLTSNVEWWNLPNEIVGASAQEAVNSINKRVVIGSESVDIVSENGETLASYGEEANIYSDGVALFNANANGYTTELILSYETTETAFGSKISITPSKYISAVIRCTDANNSELKWRISDPFRDTIKTLPTEIIIDNFASEITLPITLEYVGVEGPPPYSPDAPKYHDQPTNIKLKGSQKISGNLVVEGITSGIISYADFDFDMPAISANASAGLHITYDDVENAGNMIPIGIIGWAIIGNNTIRRSVSTFCAGPYFETETSEYDLAYFAFYNMRSTAVKAGDLRLQVRVLYASCLNEL